MPAPLLPSLLIGLAGACGTLLRYWLGLATVRWSQVLPWGTILSIVTGSFAIAFFGTLTAAGGRLPMSETSRLVFMVGLCGGYTTFSSFSLQTLDLLKNGFPGRALLNIGLSVMLCMVSVAAGSMLAQGINASQPHDG